MLAAPARVPEPAADEEQDQQYDQECVVHGVSLQMRVGVRDP